MTGISAHLRHAALRQLHTELVSESLEEVTEDFRSGLTVDAEKDYIYRKIGGAINFQKYYIFVCP